VSMSAHGIPPPAVPPLIDDQSLAPRRASDRVVTAGAYVIAGDRFVFMFGLPSGATDRLGVVRLGGHREAGETAWQCAAREVLEEASVTLRPLAPPTTYWVGPPHDPDALTAGAWASEVSVAPEEPAPLLVAWSEEAGERRLSANYLARTEDTPVPAAEAQGLLLLRARDVQRVAHKTLTLNELLRDGGQAVLRADLDPYLPLAPLLQLRALAYMLDLHPFLLSN
jgi:8-oxo-dGTP pyrophosphatase MutT (NUDIX family)